MRFSAFLNGRSTGPQEDAVVMRRLAEHAAQADALGFDAVFLPDHHFTGYAPMSSDPFMFAAYLAGTLKNVHFGFSVTTVPLHHPVRFVERINLLDQLTNGRLLVGVGSGTTPEEMIGFGVHYKDASRMAEENLEIAARLWSKKMDDSPYSFDTGHYKGTVVQRIVPEALTQDYAPLMAVALRESSTLRAAQKGWPAFIPAFTPPVPASDQPFEHAKRYFTRYRDALLGAGHPEARVNHCLSWTTHTYQCVHIAETDEQAERELHAILESYQKAIDREHSYNKRAEAISGVDLVSSPPALTSEWIKTWCLHGSPDTVAAHLQPYAALGIGNVLLGFTTGPMSEERVRYADQSIRLFANEVMPRFK
ncbi:LLM class flavin-dependent oxidoreductase [Paraburkholderia metrosideri]|uniref:Alkanal monooxygenase alpha chain n=1 Tax=Paraburkholderia metrosideri TaxID=580937 RepID=A0ABM8NTZ9_9BURK|nr:LLM class flavin-dependent oxidoreductase [Paraburkholderia metrosideri]CAD6543214.1 Alkanal monooxygenase alpha chain [Paraburkholderia metrosideri]